MTGKTATVQYKPVTTLADNKSALAHWSHVAMIKYHMQYPVFMACTGTAVISLTSYPYIVWTWVSYQAVSPTNGLGTRLADRCVCVSLLPDVVTPEEHQNDCSYVYQFSSPTFVSLLKIGGWVLVRKWALACDNMVVTYFSVFNIWFTLRVSARAEAPESSIVFPPRLWKNVYKHSKVYKCPWVSNYLIHHLHYSARCEHDSKTLSLQLTSILQVSCFALVFWPELWLQCQWDHCL